MWKLDRCTLIVTHGDGDYCFKFSHLNHSCYHFAVFGQFAVSFLTQITAQ